ncbi:MAG: DUF5658 family protein [Patescibacteria group bacterium]|nr:DUF5658 family protein [Patescibacteria group bacterium]
MTSSEKSSNRSIWFGYWIIGAIVLVDCIITQFLYQKGIATEANPLQRLLHLSIPMYLVVKAIWCILGLAFVWFFESRYFKVVRRLLWVLMIAYPTLYVGLTTVSYLSSRG